LASLEGLNKGISGVFGADSVAAMGGGGKDVKLPANWRQSVEEFSGIHRWTTNYSMTELTGPIPRCREGHYHVPPYFVPFLLDPESGHTLPREGRQTGRFAALDLLAQTFWGGVISGDRVTIEWDRTCTCGFKGPHLLDPVSRYAATVTGDDKITCAATVDNTDAALQQLLAG
jgi:hypothetical protein